MPRELLTHTNPYTGNRYIEEPAIAMIEITNENGLILFTSGDRSTPAPKVPGAPWTPNGKSGCAKGTARPKRWSRRGAVDRSIGPEVAANGRLEQGLAHWVLETDELAKARRCAWCRGGPGLPLPSRARGHRGRPALPALQVPSTRKAPSPGGRQFHHVQLDLKPGKSYLVSFWIKADRHDSGHSNVMMHHDPWQQFGSFYHSGDDPVAAP